MDLSPGLKELRARALAEDIGHGDVTTAATVTAGRRGRARIPVKWPRVVFCGGPLLEAVFKLSGAEPKIISLAAEGADMARGACAAEIEGRLDGLLTGERTALNFVQLMSGIATVTADYARAGGGNRARIVDTRQAPP